MRTAYDVVRDLQRVSEEYDTGGVSAQEYYERSAPYIGELAYSMAKLFDQHEERLSNLEREHNENSAAIEDMMLDDMILRASYAFIERTGQQEKFMEFFEATVTEVSAQSYRREFHLVKPN
jgi:hypothetical protein